MLKYKRKERQEMKKGGKVITKKRKELQRDLQRLLKEDKEGEKETETEGKKRRIRVSETKSLEIPKER